MKSLVALLALLPILASSAPDYGPQPPSSYGYSKPPEKPKHNCTVEDVTEIADVCPPTLETNCENVDVPVKEVIDGEYCYESVSTVCEESSETVDNEICTYSYNKVYEDATGRTVDVQFQRQSNVQMVTVCQPSYGYHSYGNQNCQEIAQETTYNVPVVNQVDVPVRLGYPEPVRSCVNKPITLPRLSCETKSEQKCTSQPQVVDSVQSVEKCTVRQGPPNCQRIELTLPKQVCKEIIYGYAEEKPQSYKPEPEPQYRQPEPYQPQPQPQPQPTTPPAPSYQPQPTTPQAPRYPQPSTPQAPRYPQPTTPQAPRYPQPTTTQAPRRYPQPSTPQPPRYSQPSTPQPARYPQPTAPQAPRYGQPTQPSAPPGYPSFFF